MMNVFQQKLAKLLPGDDLGFLPFVPLDNVVREANIDQASSASFSSLAESSNVLQHHGHALTALLKCSFLTFLKHVIENKSLSLFLDSYVTYRSKPVTDDSDSRSGDSTNVHLFKLDKLVFSVFCRLASVSNEHRHAIGQKDAPNAMALSDAELDEQYAAVVGSLRWMSVPVLLDVVGIVGESNVHLSHKLLQAVVRLKPSFTDELIIVLKETHKVSVELVQNVWQTKDRLESAMHRQSSVPKKGSRTIDKSMLSKDSAPEHLKSLLDLAFFAVDILYALCGLFSALDKVYLMDSPFFRDHCLSVEYGSTWYQIVQLIYEIAVPVLIRTVASNAFKDRIDELSAQIGSSLRDVVDSLRYWALKNVREMVGICAHGLQHAHLRHAHRKSGAVDKAVTSQSWLDLFSLRLDADKILVGAFVDSAQLQLGALASDFLQSCDKQQMHALLQACQDPLDLHTIDALLGALCLEDSLLPKRISKASKSSSVLGTSSTVAMLRETSHQSPDVQLQTVGDDDLHDKIVSIQGIFPDLGEGFIEACLAFYKSNTEELIEALLSDNLHPKLSGIDRALKKVWVGKSGLVRDASALQISKQKNGNGDRSTSKKKDQISLKAFMNQSIEENKTFKAVQKAVVEEIERTELHDAYIVNKLYDDDYDDQYDESWGNKKPGMESEDANTSTKEKASSRGGNWQQQMAETRRYNALLREEEKEIEFWKNLDLGNKRNAQGLANKNNWKSELAAAAAAADAPPPAPGTESKIIQPLPANSSVGQKLTSKPKSQAARPPKANGEDTKSRSDHDKTVAVDKPGGDDKHQSGRRHHHNKFDRTKEERRRGFDKKQAKMNLSG